MYRVSKEFRTETAHRLKFHNGRCKHIHGHSYRFVVRLERSELDQNGMLEDFGRLKKIAGDIIDEYDHALVLTHDDPIAHLFENQGFRLILWEKEPTAENMAQKIAHEVQEHYQDCVVSVTVWETATSYADYTTGRLV